MTVPVLTGSRVVLRPPVEADVSARQELGLDPEIHRMFGGSRALLAPYTQEMALAWLSMMQEDPHAWAIDVGARLIGEIRLEKLEPVDRRATLAVGILDPAALGKGYGTEAVTLMLAHAFGALGLHRIGFASSHTMNAPSAATRSAASSSKGASASPRWLTAPGTTTS
jgi:RimJ/RimL family protein N-acetyltransferase